MTESAAGRVRSFSARARDIVSGKATFVKPAHEKFVQEMYDRGVINKNMTVSERVDILKTEYAKRNVASYFQRYEPNGYEDVMEAFKSGKLKVSEVLRNKEAFIKDYPALEFIEIVPDYTWLTDVNEKFKKNSKYITDSNYYKRPKLDKYADKKWFDKYGIDFQAWLANPTMDLTKMVPTKNIEEYEYLTQLVGIRKQVLENYNISDTHNEFQATQISASKFEKFARLSNLSNISQKKDAIKDFFQSRKDEMWYGELMNNEDLNQIGSTVDVKIIPKYYQSKLEDPDMLTENSLEAAMLDLKQSILYKEKNAAESTLKALEVKVSNQRFISNGGFQRRNKILKEGAVSNYYAFVQEYLDYKLYGIQQSRHFEVSIFGKQVDLTKLAMNMQSIARFGNLGFNPFVDMTSATTGIISNIVDRFAGDHYHSSSANRGNSLITELSKDFASEWGVTAKKSNLNHILEFLGVVDPKERLENSSFGRIGRLMSKLPFLGAQIANHPVGPRISLTILSDFRLVDGRVMNYQDFLKSERIKNPQTYSQKLVDAKWNAFKKDSMYDMLSITPNGVTYNERFKEAFPENTEEIFESIAQRMSAKVKQVVQSADGVMNDTDQAAAQRDVLTNPLLMHKGWLLINLTRKFKRNHFNLAAGSMEEGHYLTLVKLVQDLKFNALNPIAVKQWMEEQENFRKANARRVAVEMSVLASILLLGMLIFSADDDDDTEIENLAQLIYLRTTSEFASSTFFGIPGSIIDSAKSPIASLSTFEKLNPVELMSIAMDDGPTASVRRALEATPVKQVFKFADLQDQVDKYRHFNDATLFNLGEQKSE